MLEPRICPPRKEACEGQIVRLERAAGGETPWMLHVVESEWDHERDEGPVDDDRKVRRVPTPTNAPTCLVTTICPMATGAP